MATCGGVSNHIQVCYDIIGRDSGGFTVRFYVNTIAWGWNDDQVLQIRGSNGVAYDHGYRASASSGQSKELTRIDIGFPAPPGGCVNFSATVVDIAGGGSPSVSGTDCAYALPPSPPTVAFVNIGQTTLGLYTAAAGAENGATTDAVNYRLHRTDNGALIGDIQGGYGGVTFSGLQPGVSYTGYGQSHNAAGWGGWSAAAYAVTAAAVPGPTAVAVDQVTATSARLFGPTIPPTNGSAIDVVAYRLYRVSDNAYLGELQGGWDGRTFTGLTRATTYDAYALSHNGVGWGPTGAAWRFNTLPSVPGAPGKPVISSITPTSAVASFTAPTDNGGQTITTYEVQYSLDPTFATGTVTQATGTLTNLVPGGGYSVRVRAVNASGPGAWSAVTTFTTLTGMKVYNGTTWVDSPIYSYNGTAWVASEVRIYNGTAWVPTG